MLWLVGEIKTNPDPEGDILKTARFARKKWTWSVFHVSLHADRHEGLYVKCNFFQSLMKVEFQYNTSILKNHSIPVNNSSFICTDGPDLIDAHQGSQCLLKEETEFATC
jgi:hypothetical protein